MKILSKKELQNKILAKKDEIIFLLNEQHYDFADLYMKFLSMGVIAQYEIFCFYVLLYCYADIEKLEDILVNFNHEYWYIDKTGNSVQADFLFELFTNAQDGYYILGMHSANEKNGAVLACHYGNVKDLLVQYLGKYLTDENLIKEFYRSICDIILPTTKEFYEYVKSGKGIKGTFTGYTQENGFAVFEKPKELPDGLKEFLISCTQEDIDNLMEKKHLHGLEELAKHTNFSTEELSTIYFNGVLCKVDKIKEQILN